MCDTAQYPSRRSNEDVPKTCPPAIHLLIKPERAGRFPLPILYPRLNTFDYIRLAQAGRVHNGPGTQFACIEPTKLELCPMLRMLMPRVCRGIIGLLKILSGFIIECTSRLVSIEEERSPDSLSLELCPYIRSVSLPSSSPSLLVSISCFPKSGRVAWHWLGWLECRSGSPAGARSPMQNYYSSRSWETSFLGSLSTDTRLGLGLYARSS